MALQQGHAKFWQYTESQWKVVLNWIGDTVCKDYLSCLSHLRTKPLLKSLCSHLTVSTPLSLTLDLLTGMLWLQLPFLHNNSLRMKLAKHGQISSVDHLCHQSSPNRSWMQCHVVLCDFGGDILALQRKSLYPVWGDEQEQEWGIWVGGGHWLSGTHINGIEGEHAELLHMFQPRGMSKRYSVPQWSMHTILDNWVVFG